MLNSPMMSFEIVRNGFTGECRRQPVQVVSEKSSAEDKCEQFPPKMQTKKRLSSEGERDGTKGDVEISKKIKVEKIHPEPATKWFQSSKSLGN